MISIIIPTCQRPTELSQCIQGVQRAIANYTESWEILVSDDGIDTSYSECNDTFHNVRHVSGPRRGPAANRNHAASLAVGEWLIFCDDDCVPTEGWLDAYQKFFSGPCKVLEGRTLPSGIRTRLDEECPVNESGGHLWSCNFAIKRELFLSLDGFDPNFPSPALEDVDLRIRIQKEKLKIQFVPDALVFHPWRIRKDEAYIELHAASMHYLLIKHPEMAHAHTVKHLSKVFIRYLLKSWMPGILVYRGRGCIRDLKLLSYSLILALSPLKN